jgi:hypothetical protein
MTVFAAENTRGRVGKHVIDPSGAKIGEMEAVYVDTTSDAPAFATVEVGMIGRHRLAFVPLGGATVSPDAVRVQFDKKQVTDEPGWSRSPAAPACDAPGLTTGPAG